jgi:1-acylglycerone phosphate reductase
MDCLLHLLAITEHIFTRCSEGGLGHALAKEFHSRGLRVFAAARTLESMATLAGSGIETFEIDIASSESISMLKDRLTTLVGGRLDILVINAYVPYLPGSPEC